MEKLKICKVCGETEETTIFYKSDASICKSCRSKKAAQKRAEKIGKEYTPKIKIAPGFKYCNSCKRILPLSEFYTLSKIKKNGEHVVYSRCKECERSIVLNHPKRDEYITNSNQNKLEKKHNDLKYNQYINDLNKKHYNNEVGIITHMLYSAKKRALKNNLEFNLVPEDIILPSHCPILGIELMKGTKSNYQNTYSLDRIDNTKGYIKGNVQVISMLANTMKNSATPEQLKMFANNIITYLDKK